MTTAVSFSSCCPVHGLVFKMGRCLTFCERPRLVAKAGAPVSPTRNACPRPLDFLRRRAAVASECNWRSAAELSSGNGSDFVEGAIVGSGRWWWWWMAGQSDSLRDGRRRSARPEGFTVSKGRCCSFCSLQSRSQTPTVSSFAPNQITITRRRSRSTRALVPRAGKLEKKKRRGVTESCETRRGIKTIIRVSC